MGAAVGAQNVVGTGEETTYGTAVTVDRFTEITGESLVRNNRTITSASFGNGGTRNLARGSRTALLGHDVTGNLDVEVSRTGFGRLIKHLLGGTPTVVQQGATTAWLQTHTLGDLTGKSLTIQKQLRDASNAEVESFTIAGSKLTSGEFTIANDNTLRASFGIDGRIVVTSTPPAAASYANLKTFHFGQAALKVAGSTVTTVLSEARVRLDNNLKVDRYGLGSSGTKAEPIDNGRPTVSGSVTAEFDTPVTFYDRFAAYSGHELILEFVGDVISGAFSETFRITVPEVRFSQATPTIGDEAVLTHQVTFDGFYNGSAAGVKIEYMSVDTAV